MRAKPWHSAPIALIAWIALTGQAAPPSSHVQPPNFYAIVPPKMGVHDLVLFAARDKRIELVARAICRLRGIDPDFQGFPYSDGPVWEYMIPQAMLFLAQLDAAGASK